MKRIALFLALATSACAATPLPLSPGPTASFAQVAEIGGVTIRPVRLIEDSRCPAQVQCVWAGRLRIEAVIGYRSGSEEQRREMIMGDPVVLPEGSLKLADARPEPVAGEPIAPRAYRFTFTLER